ncbi:MAG: PilZ domain-containing protein [Terracidiphilus sp.]|jgi:hypothetical protein
MEEDQNPEGLAAQATERRAGPRFQVDDDATLLLVSDGRQVQGRVLDLSLKGCRMRTKDRFNAGTDVRVEVTFRVNGIAFRFFGLTQWTNQWNVVGIQFIEVPQRRLSDLAEVVGEVEADAAARAELMVLEGLPEEALAAEGLPQQLETDCLEQDAPGPVPELAPEHLWIHAVADRSEDFEAPTHPANQILGFANPDRRVQLQQAVDTSAAICLIPGGTRLKGLTLELSLTGCRIRTDARFTVPIYTRVEVEFRAAGLPFRLGGVVQSIEDRRQVVVKFLDMSERKTTQLAQLMADLEENQQSGGVEKT